MQIENTGSCSSGPNWQCPPEKLSFHEREVHIWFAELDQPRHSMYKLLKSLNRDEREKADCFVFEPDKMRFIARRGILRTILGRYYLDIDPVLVEFQYGSRGNLFCLPALINRLCSSTFLIRTNLQYMLFKDFELGIDIEYMRDMPEALDIINGFCTEYEKARFKSIPDYYKQEAFSTAGLEKRHISKQSGKGFISRWIDLMYPWHLESPPAC